LRVVVRLRSSRVGECSSVVWGGFNLTLRADDNLDRVPSPVECPQHDYSYSYPLSTIPTTYNHVRLFGRAYMYAAQRLRRPPQASTRTAAAAAKDWYEHLLGSSYTNMLREGRLYKTGADATTLGGYLIMNSMLCSPGITRCVRVQNLAHECDSTSQTRLFLQTNTSSSLISTSLGQCMSWQALRL
jgi:hypothetical protein